MKKSCPKWDSYPGPFAYEANALSVELSELMNIDHLKVSAFYVECAFKSYLYYLVDVVKCVVV